MTACCVKLHCIPDYQHELNELVNRAKDTQIHLEKLQERIRELKTQLDDGLSEIDSNITKLKPVNEKDVQTPFINQIASVVVKTGASIVTHQPAMTPWNSILRLFQKSQ